MNLILSKLTFKLNNLLAIFMICVILSIIGVYLLAKIVIYIKLLFSTLKRDIKGLIHVVFIQFRIRNFRKNNATAVTEFKKLVKKHPNKVVFYFQDEIWTFKHLDKFSNQVAHVFSNLNFKKGDEVSLFMESRPEYVGIWLGLVKIGVVTALINSNQRNKPLIHSITSIHSKAVIYESKLEDALVEIYSSLKSCTNLKYFRFGSKNESSLPAYDLNQLLFEAEPSEFVNTHKGNFEDRILYIFTSGTTGLPKAAVIKNCRYLFVAAGIESLTDFGNEGVLYTSIPLYHFSGGVMGVGLCLVYGGSMVIRNKFSATNFWKDCIKYRCTAAQYIGEICRYLLSQPESPEDRSHQVKIMFGNGLRPTVWKEFVDRFGIKTIREFYGSTEGNANIVNTDNQIGACGFVCQLIPGRLLDFFYSVSIIKVDEETGKPIRNSKGLCIRGKPGDTGEFVGKIKKNDPLRAFDGYVNEEASQKKIVRNVYQKGDEFYSSGDLVYLDELGYVYFKDRTGDTFRWKGENVSTTEVEAIINNIYKEADCVVYGVEIPGCEGKTGMASLSAENKQVNLDHLLSQLTKVLPKYAIPNFIRLTKTISMTGTFKLLKHTLQKQGYCLTSTDDTIYYLNWEKKCYLKLDQKAYEAIINSEMSF